MPDRDLDALTASRTTRGYITIGIDEEQPAAVIPVGVFGGEARRRAASFRSVSLTMLYLSNTERFLWPLISQEPRMLRTGTPPR
jgi:hypothetical protein